MNNNIKENGMVGGFREMEKSMNPRVHYKQTREGVSHNHKWSADLPGVRLGSPLPSDMSPLPKPGQAQPKDAKLLAVAVCSLREMQLYLQALSLPRHGIALPSWQLGFSLHTRLSDEVQPPASPKSFLSLPSTLAWALGWGMQKRKSGFKSFLPGS